MDYTLIRNLKDRSMIELWLHEHKKKFLVCVIHEDCLDYALNEVLVDYNEVGVNFTLKGETK